MDEPTVPGDNGPATAPLPLPEGDCRESGLTIPSASLRRGLIDWFREHRQLEIARSWARLEEVPRDPEAGALPEPPS